MAYKNDVFNKENIRYWIEYFLKYWKGRVNRFTYPDVSWNKQLSSCTDAALGARFCANVVFIT